MKLQIVGWRRLFDGEGRKAYLYTRGRLPFPITMGMKYYALMRRPGGAEAFGVWCALCLLAARKPPPRDGWLTTTGDGSGVGLTIDELSAYTGIPSDVLERAIRLLTTNRIAMLVDREPLETEVAKLETDESGNDELFAPFREADFPQSFRLFWSAYPNKASQIEAYLAWKEVVADERVGKIVVATARRVAREWAAAPPKLIPTAAEWLRERAWEEAAPEMAPLRRVFAERVPPIPPAAANHARYFEDVIELFRYGCYPPRLLDLFSPAHYEDFPRARCVGLTSKECWIEAVDHDTALEVVLFDGLIARAIANKYKFDPPPKIHVFVADALERKDANA